MLQIKTVVCLSLLLALVLFTGALCSGYEEDDIYVPLDAVQLEGTIDSINSNRAGNGEVLIDDLLYSFSPSTEFLTSIKGTRVSIDSFSQGEYVGLVVRKSILLRVWPEERGDGDPLPVEAETQEKKQQGKGLRLENGVWVN